MLLKMFVPIYEVTNYCNAPTSVKLNGLIKTDSIVKIKPLVKPLETQYGTIAAHVLYGDYNDPGEGFITTEWYTALVEALR